MSLPGAVQPLAAETPQPSLFAPRAEAIEPHGPAGEVYGAWGGVRLRDLAELTRLRIAALVLVTVAVSAIVAGWGLPPAGLLAAALLGTALVAGSACMLNQWLERHSDALMNRTADRPLPAGRLRPADVLASGLAAAAGGVGVLAWAVNLRTALLGLLTWSLYVWVYTPLKRRTVANTAVGAIAGALPVLMGWAAAGGHFDLRAAALFLVVYLWQFPHFMAIAWLYRGEYARAGLKMLPVVDPAGGRAGRLAVCAAAALLPMSLLPALGAAGLLYLLGACLLGAGQLFAACRFFGRPADDTARGLLLASLVYLPGILALLMLVPFFSL